MEIRLRNVKNGDKLPHQLALLEGDITPSKDPAIRGELYVSIDCQSNSCSDHVTNELHLVWPIRSSRFKAIAPLHHGQNQICMRFEHCISLVTLFYEPPLTNGHFVRPLYLICDDDKYNGRFQGPECPSLRTAQVAIQKIDLGIKLIQLFVAESLHRQGLTRRTFRLDTESGLPSCRVYHLSGTTTARASTMSEPELWNLVKDALAMDTELTDKERSKFIAFVSFTRYANPEGLLSLTHREMLEMTRGHCALGGGGLAVLGTGCLHTWASTLSELVSRFTDCTKIDRTRLLDDSRYRETYWACFATTLGAACHELGHTFDLCHSEGGLMAGDFGEIHRAFILPELLDDSKNLVGEDRQDEDPVPSTQNPEDLVSNGISASSLITRVKLKRCLGNDWEAASFQRAEAIWLRYHKWLNAPHPNNSGQGPQLSGFQIRARHGLRIVMLANCDESSERDKTTRRYYEFPNGGGRLIFHLDKEELQKLARDSKSVKIMAEDSYGNTLISALPSASLLEEQKLL